jgi:molecular chaperone DnaK
LDIIFGLDFGTTNSLVSLIDRGTLLSLVNQETEAPHPSMFILQGEEVKVGQSAKELANDADEHAAGDVVRSPKIYLGDDDNQFPIPGRKDYHRVDISSAVLAHLVRDAEARSVPFFLKKAVFTVPVSFDGKTRQELRQAATKAGIDVCFFVHEPLAALYGYFKEQSESGEGIEDYDGSYVLVFDWGGGTLDLTLCQIRGGVLHQIVNSGNADIGGDTFDDNITNYVKTQHASQHNVTGLQAHINPDVTVKLKIMCENAKKRLSDSDEADIFIRNFLTKSGPSATLDVTITRIELEEICEPRINSGIDMIDQLLDKVGLDHSSVAMCLPTGGMVNMPAIRSRLDQLFPGRVVTARHGDRIISEGAAWIAYDEAIPVLSKPLEVMDASGTPNVIAQANEPLPVDGSVKDINLSQFYCTDPREGVVTFSFQRPKLVGRYGLETPRATYGMITIEVDNLAKPLLERLNLSVKVDENYVVKIAASSSMRGDTANLEISNLEFALRAQNGSNSSSPNDDDDGYEVSESSAKQITQNTYPEIRSTVSLHGGRRGAESIAGDIIDGYWKPFEVGNPSLTSKQQEEKMYYAPCSLCQRMQPYIIRDGCTHEKCPESGGV